MTTYPTASEDPGRLLRLALGLDAVASGAVGAVSAVAANAVDELLGIPSGLLAPLGLFLLVYAAGLWLIRSRPRVSRQAVWVVIAGNLAWVATSVAAVAIGWLSLTAVGTAFVLAQAAAVALFAELRFSGLRRSHARTA